MSQIDSDKKLKQLIVSINFMTLSGTFRIFFIETQNHSIRSKMSQIASKTPVIGTINFIAKLLDVINNYIFL